MARERMSLKRFIDRYITAGSEQKLSCEVQVDGAQAKLGEPVPVIVTGTVNSGGTITGVSATGTVPVTEASAASTLTAVTNAATYNLITTNLLDTGQHFARVDSASATAINGQHKIFNVLLTSDGAGAVAATAIVPALAGYTGHARIIGVWADSTDAATTFTFSVAAGTILGPAVHVESLTANSVTQFGAAAAGQTGCPVYLRGTIAADDNKALQCAVAGYAATANLWVFGEYWYET